MAAEADDDRHGVNRLVIHPSNRLKAVYEIVLVVLTGAAGMVLPLQAAFVLP